MMPQLCGARPGDREAHCGSLLWWIWLGLAAAGAPLVESILESAVLWVCFYLQGVQGRLGATWCGPVVRSF